MAANRERDGRKIRELVAANWRVMTVWQCSLDDRDRTVSAIEEFLMGSRTVGATRAEKD
jgi:G:T-mismatch repair DNA endonuclease (very short patch repair protein)